MQQRIGVQHLRAAGRRARRPRAACTSTSAGRARPAPAGTGKLRPLSPPSRRRTRWRAPPSGRRRSCSVARLAPGAQVGARLVAVQAHHLSPAAACPSSSTRPATVPAVAGSTRDAAAARGRRRRSAASSRGQRRAGRGAGARPAGSRIIGLTRRGCRRRAVPPASRILRNTRSSIQCAVPPLDRVHLHAADQHREVQVVAAGQPGRARAAERLALLDGVALLHVHRRQVRVERLHAQPVIDDDAVAVDAEDRPRARPRRGWRRSPAPARSRRGRSRGASADRFPCPRRSRCGDRRSAIPPACCRAARTPPATASRARSWRPARRWPALFCWRRSRLMVRNAGSRSSLAFVGQAERRRVRGDRRHHARQERLVDRDARALEASSGTAAGRPRRRLVAGLVAREDHDRRVGVLVVGQGEERHLAARDR